MHPVGPKPPRVYWRRRLIVVAALVIVVVLIVMLIGKLAGGSSAASPVASKPSASQVPNCAEGDLALSLVAGQDSYPASAKPTFTATVVNNGDRCTIDTSTSGYELVITSGKDRIYSSADCAEPAVPQLQLMDRGSTQKLNIDWPRVRSAAGCPTGAAAPAPGSYRAVLTMAGASSDQVSFQLG